jgi:hypothetical protein
MLVFPCGSVAAGIGSPVEPVCRRFKNTLSQLAVGAYAISHFVDALGIAIFQLSPCNGAMAWRGHGDFWILPRSWA